MTSPAGGCKRVVIIGAGIAGLVTAKVLREDGFDVRVFEQEPEIGGVWAPSRTYPGLRANNSRNTYAYSDHPYDSAADMFPTAEQVRRYLASYADRFALTPLIELSTGVVRVMRSGAGFEVAVHGPGGPATVACDFVVVCAGTYSDPSLPEIPGAQQFTGAIRHSSQAIDPGLFARKRVVVVGAGKSSLDCAAWAAETAQRCTLVFRTAHWMAPRYLPGGVPIDGVALGRVLELFLRYHRLTRVERFLHGPGAPITRLFWWASGLLLRWLLRMPAPMVPDHPLARGLENLGFAPEFYRLARDGRVQLRHDAITAFDDDGVVLGDGERITADVVVFATGWRQKLPFLSSDLASIVLREGRFRLFRHILPPAEQRLGFVGYASSTACQLSSEVSAHWLSQAFRGELTLPAVADMDAQIDRVHAWLAEEFPTRAEGYFLGPHLLHHVDELLDDMGVPTRLTRNVIAEYFGAFTPARYADLTEQRRVARRPNRATVPNCPVFPQVGADNSARSRRG